MSSMLAMLQTLFPVTRTTLRDIFIYDRVEHTTERVSVADGGVQANGDSLSPSISGDGRYIAFESSASNLVQNDTNNMVDCFIYDRVTHTIQRASLTSEGTQVEFTPGDIGLTANISADGRYVTFKSNASSFVPNRTNAAYDIFVVDRTLLPNQAQTNHAPLASDINTNVNEDANNPATLAALFTDADLSDTFSFSFDPTNTKGKVTNNDDGTSLIDPNGKFENLGVGQTATDTFSYTVTDNHGASSAPATATVAIHGENDYPIALPDGAQLVKGASISGNVRANDSDLDDSDVLHVTMVNGDSAKVGAIVDTPFGKLALNADGTYIFGKEDFPIKDAQVVDHFTYTISDGHGGEATTNLDFTILSNTTAKHGLTADQILSNYGAGSADHGSLSFLATMAEASYHLSIKDDNPVLSASCYKKIDQSLDWLTPNDIKVNVGTLKDGI